MLTKKVKPLTIDELGLAKDCLSTNAAVPGKLLMNPKQLCGYQFTSFVYIGMHWQMNDKRGITLDGESDCFTLCAALY